MQQNIHRQWSLLVKQFVCKQRWQRTVVSSATFSPNSSSNVRPALNLLLGLGVTESSSITTAVNRRAFWSYAHLSCRTISPLRSERLLHAGNAGNWCNKEVQTVKEEVREGKEAKEEDAGKYMRSIAPSNFDKKILVWTGKYPSIDAVPPLVSDATLNWAKNKFRIYVNIAMAAATFGTALVMIYFGRRRSERGETVARMNMMRHPNQYQRHITPQADESK